MCDEQISFCSPFHDFMLENMRRFVFELQGKKSVAINKQLQQLAFINPGRLTAEFNPEFSNREKRKLSRLMEQQGGRNDIGYVLLSLNLFL